MRRSLRDQLRRLFFLLFNCQKDKFHIEHSRLFYQNK
jgi:hypothetical protein